MNRIIMLRITNMILFISMVLQALTGVILFFRIFTDRPRIFMSLVELHEYNGLFLIALVVVHLIQNRGWIKSQFSARSRG